MNCRLTGMTGFVCVAALTVTAQTKPAPSAQEIWTKSRTLGTRTPLKANLTVTLWDEKGKAETSSLVVRDGKGRIRTEYLSPAQDKGRIVILNGKTRWQYEPSKPMLIQSPFVVRQPDSEDIPLELRSYRIAMDAKPQTVSGRKCYALLLTPKYAGLGVQKRWVDAQTFATVQTETRYSDGTLASRVSYSNLQFHPILKASDFIPPAAPGTKTIRHTAPETPQTPAEMTQLARAQGLMSETPLGFRLRRVLNGDKPKTQQFLYSDGLFFLSVFVETGFGERVDARPPWKPVQIGKLTAHELKRPHSNVIVWMKQGRRYSLMARMGHETLREFVRSVVL